jgi:beta-glucosidase
VQQSDYIAPTMVYQHRTSSGEISPTEETPLTDSILEEEDEEEECEEDEPAITPRSTEFSHRPSHHKHHHRHHRRKSSPTDVVGQSPQFLENLLGLLTPRRAIASTALIMIVATVIANQQRMKIPKVPHGAFPPQFVWGSATSSYQVEGAVHAGGRGPSIWDSYCEWPNTVADNSSGAVACDHYHRMVDDVKLMKSLGLKAYRFSISWPRIYPMGGGKINADGVAFYNKLIDTLLEHGIEPWVTLYHWDLPQALEDKYKGWLGPAIVKDFARYARTCFGLYGDRVKRWITINESWTVAVQSYTDGTKAPGRSDNAPFDTYLAGHHLVLAHARAARIYKDEFFPMQRGMIGIANCGDFRYPLDPDALEDVQAAERAMLFQYGWLTDPFFFGDYPFEMRAILGARLPHFTEEEQKDLVGSTDFLGLNHYSSLYAADSKEDSSNDGYWSDMHVDFSSDPSWKKNFMGWSIVPDGCRDLLLWISKRYGNPIIVITENGTAEDEPDSETAFHDEGRRQYLEDYIRACKQAIEAGVELAGYFAWSLMDNFEWEYGYTRRFGIVRVNFETLERTPKLSAIWYRDTIEAGGSNIPAI